MAAAIPIEQNPTVPSTGGAAISPHAEPSADDALGDMLADLRDARAEAVEEGFPPPSDVSITRAERVLTETRRFSTRRFEVYPTPDGEIAIDMPATGGSVLLLCDSDGGALCLVNLNGDKRQKRYASADELPDSFLVQAAVYSAAEGLPLCAERDMPARPSPSAHEGA